MILKRIPTARSKVKRAAPMLGLIVRMVLTLAGSASAECGWVLWQHTTPVEPPVAPLGKVRLSTYASKRECAQEGRELVQAGRSGRQPSFVRRPWCPHGDRRECDLSLSSQPVHPAWGPRP